MSKGRSIRQKGAVTAESEVRSAATGLLWRGDAGYEETRRRMWNACVPGRFPAVIVQPHNEQEVVNAVRLARQRDMRITVRSGGHSWAASFLRDGAMLIDLSHMANFAINAEEGTAWVQPGLKGTDLNRALRKHDLFFPSGHCMSVGLGGFLLQGGFGWNSRLWGPACVSVTGIDVVTANGELVHADEREHPDLYWAARGAGPGFFGVVTRFELKLQPRPKVMMRSDYLYPIDMLDEVMRWLLTIQPDLARTMECMLCAAGYFRPSRARSARNRPCPRMWPRRGLGSARAARVISGC